MSNDDAELEKLAVGIATDNAASMWGYCNGGSAGATEEIRYFKHNKELPGHKHCIMDRCYPPIIAALKSVRDTERVENVKLREANKIANQAIGDIANECAGYVDQLTAANAAREVEQKTHDQIGSICFAAGAESHDGTSVSAVNSLVAKLAEANSAREKADGYRERLRGRFHLLTDVKNEWQARAESAERRVRDIAAAVDEVGKYVSDDQGFIVDTSSAQCTTCAGKAKLASEIKHEIGCFTRAWQDLLTATQSTNPKP